MKKKNILFVCTGNSCRSPMAEYIFRRRAGSGGSWAAGSAGLLSSGGSPASPEAVMALRELGIDLMPHRSRGVSRALVDEADLVVGLARNHVEELRRRFPDVSCKIRLLKSYSPAADGEDVADPIGQSIFVYRKVRDEIESAVSDLILDLVQQQNGAPAPAKEKGIATMKLVIGSDHGGFELKQKIKVWLAEHKLDAEDVGCDSAASVDYPDFAADVARRVSAGTADQGIIVCTTGIGVSITANKFPGVRAALCTSPHMASMARRHNDANVLALGGAVVTLEDAMGILGEWFGNDFEGGRHGRRIDKVGVYAADAAETAALQSVDPEICASILQERERQKQNLELIASENYASRAVREACGSVMTNKYAEGYPGKRWYNGCEFVDEAERLAIERAKKLFGAEHANVQPHCGSAANMAVYFAALQPGDKLMAMSLADGGHLTHGHKMNFSGRFYEIVPYGVSRETEQLDYDAIAQLAVEQKPRMICAGASAYSRIIDFARLREIADSVGALLMVDMAHIAGMVASGCHPSPVPHADFVTTTTHKTLRGPRGGLILCKAPHAAEIDKQVFPGIQGGPLMHTIAGKAVCLQEALQPSFAAYQRQVVANAKALAAALAAAGLRIVSGGTDNHLMLVDLTGAGVTGKDAAAALDRARITVNKNAIPFDTKSPFVTSGIRVGSPAVTTRGMKEAEMGQIAALIAEVVNAPADEAVLARVKQAVTDLTVRFPVP